METRSSPPSFRADWEGWDHAFQQFSAATGLVVSAYDLRGQLQAGRYMPTRLAKLLATSDLWKPNGAGVALEWELSKRCINSGSLTSDWFYEEIRVQALPLKHLDTPFGSVVFGWCFEGFASSIICDKIARLINMPSARLWSEARLESPVSEARMSTYTDLLHTLVSSIGRQTEAIERLNDLNRLREVFLATVSHEMRTPLAALSMRLELLQQSRLDDPTQIRAGINAMMKHVEKETLLVEDLIDASRTLTGQLSVTLRPVSLQEILRAALATVEPKAAVKNVVLDTQGITEMPNIEVQGDPERLQQLFWNLLFNAVKFTPNGGRVGINVVPRLTANEIEVSDSGQGIASHFIPQVFGAFNKQRANNEEGLGLGLFIAQHIAELHNGTIRVTSPGENQGATFIVSLPKIQEQKNVPVLEFSGHGKFEKITPK